MPSSDGHPEYDANLLSAAPVPTKTMVQSGYATDLLDKPRRDDLESARHKSLSRHTTLPNGARAPAPSTEPKDASTAFVRTKPSPFPEKRPFYRTRRGIIILVIVAIVLLAAIIGGAVGGTLANRKPVPVPIIGNSIVSPPASSGDVGVAPPTETGGVATSVVKSTTTVPSPGPSISSPVPRLPTIGLAFTPPA